MQNRHPTFPKNTNTTNSIKQFILVFPSQQLLNLNPISARRRPGASPRLQCSLVHLAGDRGDILHRLHRSDRGGLDVFEVRLFEDAGHVGLRSLEKPRLLGCGYGFGIYPWRRWRSHVFKEVSTWSGTMGNMCR